MNFLDILAEISALQKKYNRLSPADFKTQLDTLVAQIPENIQENLHFILTKDPISNATIPVEFQIFGKYFNRGVYEELLQYALISYYFEPTGNPQEHALKLSVLFGDVASALKYIAQSKLPFHSACAFKLPNVHLCKFELWQKHAKKYMCDSRFPKILENAREIETLIEPEKHRKLNFAAIEEKKNAIKSKHHAWKKLKRKHGTLTHAEKSTFLSLGQDLLRMQEKLVELCENIPLTNADITILYAFFEHFCKLVNPAYQYFLNHGLTRTDFDYFTLLDRSQAGKTIPDFMLDGTSIGHPGYYMMKIPVQDEMFAAKAACLGRLTNCCQSLSGEAGQPCAIHGLTSAYGGFYLVCEGNVNAPKLDDTVIAQSWVWRSANDALVFDSVEMPTEKKIETYADLAVDFYRHVAIFLVSQGYTNKVLCGYTPLGIANSIRVAQPFEFKNETFKDYDDYCDSNIQGIIFDKDKPYYSFSYMNVDNTLALEFITKNFQSSLPLAALQDFVAMLNWSMLYNAILFDTIKEMAKIFQREDECENLISVIHNFLKNNLACKKLINFIKKYPLFNLIDEEGRTLLMKAAKKCNVSLIKELLKSTHYLHYKDKMGQTVIEHLVSESAFDKNNYISTILTWLAPIKQFQSVTESVMLNVVNLFYEACPDEEKTALLNKCSFQAALHGYKEMMAALMIFKEFDIHYKNAEGVTALMAAAQGGQLEVFEILLSKGANILDTDKYHNTVLLHAIKGKNADIIELIFENNINIHNENKCTSLIDAIDSGDNDVVEKLIELGADLSVKKGEFAALWQAVWRNNISLVKLLIEKGIQVNAPENKSVLRVAVMSLNEEITFELLKNGATLSETDEKLFDENEMDFLTWIQSKLKEPENQLQHQNMIAYYTSLP